MVEHESDFEIPQDAIRCCNSNMLVDSGKN